MGQKEGGRRVDAPRGVVGRVEGTTDVPCVDSAHGRSGNGVDASENGVNLNVSTASLPPALDDANVVAEDLEVTACRRAGDKVSDKELKANGLCPANVPAVAFPPRNKAPRPPKGADSDGDANTGAGVRVSMGVDEGLGSRDGSGDKGKG
jgi:hypothetical protein